MFHCASYPDCGCGDSCENRNVPIRTKLPSLAEATLQIARGQVGVEEERENWGPRIREYLKEAGVTVPAPWCAAFTNWCARIAAESLDLVSPLESVPLQAYVQSYFEHFKDHVVPAKKAKPGDLILLYYPSLKRYGHIGFVISVDRKNGTVRTVEGNTNSAGSREGEQVAEKVRPITSNVVFIRWTEEVA